MSIIILPFLLFLSFTSSSSSSSSSIESFQQCLKQHNDGSSAVLYLPTNSSFPTVLNAYIRNRRFMGPDTAKPLAIVTPTRESHVQATVVCSKLNRLQLRTRSGGHDYEGLSYRSPSPFVLLDLNNLRSIDIDLASETAWVQSGATLGELYYSIANKSKKSRTLSFPAGVCPTVGIGGHFVGGGYGNLLRKFGLASDNVLDARVVDPNGRILDKSTMGDLFWAIRGGGGGSFGVILSWKVKLVRVPEIVTAFQVVRKLEEGATDAFYRWQQVSTNFTPDLFIRAAPEVFYSVKDKKNKFQISFIGEYLGRVKDLVQLLNESFPELGFKEEDGKEMSWLDSVLFWVPFPEGTPAEALLSRNSSSTHNKSFKSKSDYVKEVIPKEALPQIWDLLLKTGAAFTQWNPYGGRMAEIPTDRIAYPHRAGYLFKVQYFIGWTEEGEEAEAKHIAALTALHDVVTPYVTKEPREAFFNYRDLDNGENSVDYPNWEKAKVYGEKYFKGHFERLSKIKRQFDPENFFRDQQSIPPFPY
ncbi:Berberine bridge enzyme-like 7 [Linum grandiflorum]